VVSCASSAITPARRPPADADAMVISSRHADPAGPFLKWAGGKRWLSSRIRDAYGDCERRLVEPFVGGGAIFFSIDPPKATLADANAELIRTYRALQVDVEAVIERLAQLAVDRETFIRLRDSKPRSNTDVAARMIYLNRTAFNGLYRVNRDGRFNVPFGCKPSTTALNADGLRQSARALQSATLVAQDFRRTLANCGPTDFVYLDPPYTARHNNNGFIRYNRALFSWSDQELLAKEAARLARIGSHVIVSNADHDSIRQLYPSHLFHRTRVARLSRMAASAAHRSSTTELLMLSRPEVAR
jgi:DNA adenine methylase